MIRRYIKIFILIIFMMSVSVQVRAEEKQDIQKMRYDVYAGGIHALQSNLEIDQSSPNRYNISLSAKTYGLLGKLAPWQGSFKTDGWKISDGLVPELHESVAVWRNEEEIKKYQYDKDGRFVEYSIKDDKNDGSPKKIEDDLTQGTIDVLTATLLTMQGVAKDNKCDGTKEVFDGRRRYKLVFKEKRKTMLEDSRYNVYAGPAIECSAEVRPVAGPWHEKPRGWMSIQEQGRKRGTMPTVWFATVQEGEPAVPVKVRVKTDYGTLFMHLTAYESGGKKLELGK